MPKQSNLSDEDLALLAKTGDEDANTELYYRYRQKVIGLLARTFICNWMDGEDIFQEAFPKAVSEYRRDKSSFRSFLLLVVDSKRIDKLRKANPQQQISLEETHDIGSRDTRIMAIESGLSDDKPRAKKIPDPALCQFLTPRQREAYDLFYVRGEAWDYIADRLDYSSADSARISLRNALNKARQKVELQIN